MSVPARRAAGGRNTGRGCRVDRDSQMAIITGAMARGRARRERSKARLNMAEEETRSRRPDDNHGDAVQIVELDEEAHDLSSRGSSLTLTPTPACSVETR